MEKGKEYAPLSRPPARLEKKWHVDVPTGFLFREIHGTTERFTFHTHEFYEIFLTLSEPIYHYVNGVEQALPAGSLVFIRPDDAHCFLDRGKESYRLVNLAVEGELIENLLLYLGDSLDREALLEGSLPVTCTLSEREQERLLQKLRRFHAIAAEDTAARRLRIRQFLPELFLRYFAKPVASVAEGMPPWLENVCEAMKKPEHFTVGIARMVELSGKSQEHLARSVRRYLGCTLSAYVNSLRVQYAANLLISTNLAISDICYEAGFGNISRFYDVFRESYDSSPRSYRKQEGWGRKQ